MFYAKSLHFGELLKADEATEYEAKYLNMVCDCCGETVFQRREHTRKIGDKEITVPATWSHRQSKDKVEVDVCELRSKSISSAEVKKSKAIARGQTLDVVCANLWEILTKFSTRDYTKELNGEGFNAIMKVGLGMYPNFFYTCWKLFKDHIEKQGFDIFWDSMNENAVNDLKNSKVAEHILKLQQQDRIFDKRIASEVSVFVSKLKLRDFLLPISIAVYQEFLTSVVKGKSEGFVATDQHFDAFYSDPTKPLQVAYVFQTFLNVTDWARALDWAREKTKKTEGKGFGIQKSRK